MNKKKGFILMYSVILMTFVIFLIGSIITLTTSASAGNNKIEREFNKRAELDQIGEFFVHDPVDFQVRYLAEQAGWYADVEIDYSGANPSVLKVYEGYRLILQVKTQGSKIIYWAYEGG